jgi:hypothetical protein
MFRRFVPNGDVLRAMVAMSIDKFCEFEVQMPLRLYYHIIYMRKQSMLRVILFNWDTKMGRNALRILLSPS